jgi:NTE family protein
VDLKLYAFPFILLVFLQFTGSVLAANNTSMPTEKQQVLSDESAVVSDSFEKEADETQRQLKGSADDDAVKSLLPPSGQVLTTQQKQTAGRDATTIVNQAPSSRRKISSKHADGTPTLALALGGGGARGAAHIGVLRVFQSEGIPIDIVVGNSMGAIVGGLYSAGTTLDDIYRHMEDRSLRRAYMPGGIAMKVALIPLVRLTHVLHPKHYAGLWSGEKLTNYLDSILPRPNMDISETKIPFSCVATNLLDGKAYRLTQGRLSTAIKASSAIVPFIQPVPIGNKLFVDGALRANLPASAAKDTGAGLVVAVLVDEPMPVLPPKRFLHLKNIGLRISDIVVAVADERQLQFADIVINPDVSNIPVLSDDVVDLERAVHAGELAARKALPELRKRLMLSPRAAAGAVNESTSDLSAGLNKPTIQER